MKKKLLDVSRIILDRFTNRYHDYDGYWAIGVLSSHAQYLNSSNLKFELRSNTATQTVPLLLKVEQKFKIELVHYLSLYKKKLSDLQVAYIDISFDDKCLIKQKTLYGNYYVVKVIIVDMQGRAFSVESNGYCVPHTDWINQRKLIDSLPEDEKKYYWEVDFR